MNAVDTTRCTGLGVQTVDNPVSQVEELCETSWYLCG